MTIKQCVKQYAPLLKEVTHIPAKEVEILIMHLLDVNVIYLHLNEDKTFTKIKELEKLINKRVKHYPLEYLTKQVSFYGETFIIEDNILIPRPETEILVQKAYELLKNIKNPKIIEVGTGSGIISIILAKLIPSLQSIAGDINDDALNLALKNAKKHKVEHQVEFIKSNLLEYISKDIAQSFDMCISNPPYIADDYTLPANVKFEPKNALFAGTKGDELIKTLLNQVSNKNIKYFYCEFGYDQKSYIINFAKKFDIKSLEFYKDYSNFDRGFLIEFNITNNQ